MFCPSCRANNAEGAVFCGSCGARLATGAAASPPKTSGLAIASLVLGVLGFCCGLFSITGLILGIVGLVMISRSEGETGRAGPCNRRDMHFGRRFPVPASDHAGAVAACSIQSAHGGSRG